MNSAAQLLPVMMPRPTLFNPPAERQTAPWRINGYLAYIMVWTSEEWDRLPERPIDAQYYPCGIWCALRME